MHVVCVDWVAFNKGSPRFYGAKISHNVRACVNYSAHGRKVDQEEICQTGLCYFYVGVFPNLTRFELWGKFCGIMVSSDP